MILQFVLKLRQENQLPNRNGQAAELLGQWSHKLAPVTQELMAATATSASQIHGGTPNTDCRLKIIRGVRGLPALLQAEKVNF